jgi:hypothetical protein
VLCGGSCGVYAITDQQTDLLFFTSISLSQRPSFDLPTSVCV